MIGRVARAVGKTVWHSPLRSLFVRHVLPFLRLPTRGLSDETIAAGLRELRRGDVLLSMSPHGLGSLLTPGWDHAAIVLEPDLGGTVAEMTRKGLGLVTWANFCRHARRVAILRCDRFTPDYVRKVVAGVYSLYTNRKCAYDCDFDVKNDTRHLLTCAELPFEADFEGRLGITPKRSEVTGQPYLVPDDFLRSPNVRVVWDSAKTKKEVNS